MELQEKTRLLKILLPKVAPAELLENPRSHLESMGMTESTGLEATASSVEKLQLGKSLASTEAMGLEAIIHEQFRPAQYIINDDYHEPAAPWEFLSEPVIKARIVAALLSIGRIELPGNLLQKYAGTGFVVGPNLIMTNRHVAEDFCRRRGDGEFVFKPNMASQINFRREQLPCESESLVVQRVVMIHAYWDMALLQVDGLDRQNRKPLNLSLSHPDELRGSDIVVIGYPAQDVRNDLNLQNRIFGGMYDVKRLQPGKLRERRNVQSFENSVNAVTHDASTLGGNSGSAVIDIDTGEVVALHFGGMYLDANFAVPSFELSRDQKVVNAGVRFAERSTSKNSHSNHQPDEVKRRESSTPTIVTPTTVAPASVSFNSRDISVTWTIPIIVKVSLGCPSVDRAEPLVSGLEKEMLFGRPIDDEQILARAYSRSTNSSLANRTFSWNAACMMCAASHLAYSTEKRVRSVCMNDWAFDSCEFIQMNETECFIASSVNEVLLAFRGIADAKDWLRDLTLFSIETELGAVHRGFYVGFQQVRKRIEGELSKVKAMDKKLFITGHSLGGALATIAAAELCHDFSNIALYTFGQPAVGKRDFRSHIDSSVLQYHRIVNEDDIVTKVPPSYVHCGGLIRFDHSGFVKKWTTESADAPQTSTVSLDEFRELQQNLRCRNDLRSADLQAGTLSIQSIEDHRLAKYSANILQQIQPIPAFVADLCCHPF
jgi:endonuclease G, mitochondrial